MNLKKLFVSFLCLSMVCNNTASALEVEEVTENLTTQTTDETITKDDDVILEDMVVEDEGDKQQDEISDTELSDTDGILLETEELEPAKEVTDETIDSEVENLETDVENLETDVENQQLEADIVEAGLFNSGISYRLTSDNELILASYGTSSIYLHEIEVDLSDKTVKTLTFGEGITYVSNYQKNDKMFDLNNITTINIPSSLYGLDFGTVLPNVRTVNIHQDNSDFFIENDALWSYGWQVEFICMLSSSTTLTLPSNASNVSLPELYNINKLVIPEDTSSLYTKFWNPNLKIELDPENDDLTYTDGILWSSDIPCIITTTSTTFTIPNGITNTYIGSNEYNDASGKNYIDTVKTISIGADLNSIYISDNFPSLQSFVADGGNQTFMTKDGVLYAKTNNYDGQDHAYKIQFICKSVKDITIPNEITFLDIGDVYEKLDKLNTLNLHANVEYVKCYYPWAKNLKLNVSSSNKALSFDGNWLWNKDKSLGLVVGNPTKLVIPEGCVKLPTLYEVTSGYLSSQITDLTIPSTLEEIETFHLFTSLENLTISENNKIFKKIDGVTYNKSDTTYSVISMDPGITKFTIPSDATIVTFNFGVKIPDSVTEVVIPAGLTIFDYAYNTNRWLPNAKVTFNGTNPNFTLDSNGSLWDSDTELAFQFGKPSRIDIPQGATMFQFVDDYDGNSVANCIKELYVSSTVGDSIYDVDSSSSLDKVIVDPDNENFVSVGDVLYYKDYWGNSYQLLFINKPITTLNFPEGCEGFYTHEIGPVMQERLSSVRTLNILNTMDDVEEDIFPYLSLDTVNLNGNTNFVMSNGCLYSSDYYYLYSILNSATNVTINENTHYAYSFYGKGLKSLTLSSNLSSVDLSSLYKFIKENNGTVNANNYKYYDAQNNLILRDGYYRTDALYLSSHPLNQTVTLKTSSISNMLNIGQVNTFEFIQADDYNQQITISLDEYVGGIYQITLKAEESNQMILDNISAQEVVVDANVERLRLICDERLETLKLGTNLKLLFTSAYGVDYNKGLKNIYLPSKYKGSLDVLETAGPNVSDIYYEGTEAEFDTYTPEWNADDESNFGKLIYATGAAFKAANSNLRYHFNAKENVVKKDNVELSILGDSTYYNGAALTITTPSVSDNVKTKIKANYTEDVSIIPYKLALTKSLQTGDRVKVTLTPTDMSTFKDVYVLDANNNVVKAEYYEEDSYIYFNTNKLGTIYVVTEPISGLGDVNEDSKVDYNDAIQVLKSSAGLITLTTTQKTKADVNVDNKIDYNDAIKILQYDSKMITSLN